jgi:hypothetical protein
MPFLILSQTTYTFGFFYKVKTTAYMETAYFHPRPTSNKIRLSDFHHVRCWSCLINFIGTTVSSVKICSLTVLLYIEGESNYYTCYSYLLIDLDVIRNSKSPFHSDEQVRVSRNREVKSRSLLGGVNENLLILSTLFVRFG